MMYAIVRNSTVENVIILGKIDDYPHEEGVILVETDEAGIGWSYDSETGQFSKPEEIIFVPYSITPRQCRLILAQQGLLSSVEEMIAQQDEATRITWEYALEFRRDDPLLNQLAENLGLSASQVDQFFIEAAEL